MTIISSLIFLLLGFYCIQSNIDEVQSIWLGVLGYALVVISWAIIGFQIF